MKQHFDRRKYLGTHFFAVIAVLACWSCESNPHKVDLSDVEITFESKRLDRDLFHAEETDIKALNEKLKAEYQPFYGEYLQNIIGVGKPNAPMVEVHLGQFVSDNNWQETQAEIDKVFESTGQFDQQFEEAFRYHRYHFPKDTIPTVVYYNSGFNVGVYPADGFLGVGLEWFLGSENTVIQRLAIEEFPQYLKAKMRPEYLVNNAVKGWLMVKHQDLVEKEELLKLMIYHGKILYLMDALFPEVSDEVKLNFSSEDLQWCAKNEYNIWAHLVDADLLYTSNPKDLAGFLNDGPFTPAFQQDSPARTGVWMGWQIIRQYMDKNPDTTLQQMLAEKNNQKFLKYYKP